MKWRRGTFEIKLTKRAIEDGKPNTAEGWISEPFAVHSDGYGIALTHLEGRPMTESTSLSLVFDLIAQLCLGTGQNAKNKVLEFG